MQSILSNVISQYPDTINLSICNRATVFPILQIPNVKRNFPLKTESNESHKSNQEGRLKSQSLTNKWKNVKLRGKGRTAQE